MRIILYTGKGGVGKTTIAAATGIRLAALGYKTIVISLDVAHSLRDAFDNHEKLVRQHEKKQIQIKDNLWIQEIKEYIGKRMGSKTDRAVFTVTGTTLLTFLIASRIGSIWLLYPNVLIAVALFIYCIWQIDEDGSLLSSSSVFGLATTLTYVPMDWLLSRKARLIFYLRPDFLANITTPIGIILNWVVFATLAAYCYQRLVVIFQARFTDVSHDSRIGFLGIGVLAAGVTSIGAAFGSVIIYGLGTVHLWLWNAAQIDRIPQIASVPAFVPVSFLFTFLLCPYFFGVVGKTKAATEGRENQQAGVAGIRCGIFMGAFQFFSFLLFSTWK